MKKRILICGASGFIGRNLFKHLSKNPELDVFGTFLNNKDFVENGSHPHMHRADLTNRDVARIVTRGFDCIVNAAAVTDGFGAVQSNPAAYIADNIIMNTHISEAAFINKVPHLILLSSSVIYASSPVPQKETDVELSRIHPQYFMGARIKIYVEDLCQFYSKFGDTRFTIARHANIYGPHDKFNLTKGHVFASTIEKVMSADEGGEIVVWGEGKEKRDFLYISDLMDFIEMAIYKDANPFNLLNVGSGKSISVSELAKKIIQISGKDLRIRYDQSKPSLGNEIVLNCGKVFKSFGWQPKIDLDEGIRQTISWYLKNIGGKNGK